MPSFSLMTTVWLWLKQRQPFTRSQAVADTLTQHPHLSWGGGAGVIYLFGLGMEVSGAPGIAAVCYIITLLLLANVLFRSSNFKNRQQPIVILSASVIVASLIWYLLLPTPPPTPKDLAKEVAKEIVPLLPRSTPALTPSPPAAVATPIPTPEMTPTPQIAEATATPQPPPTTRRAAVPTPAARPADHSSQVPALLKQASVLAGQERFAEAIALCQRALAIEPNNAEALDLLNNIKSARDINKKYDK